ncbi:P-type conjugative transfer protein TrbJ [Propylenella binzhouense]|uniref:P-type conjugative transfer protein TrbJ n=1 Tax=Propylenella binzhouense TaxID=2555902 RepID=A0A964T5W4_9HYPH|nr:P-type conjugative transfer protein TrbJ [Propylenella binzhouense]MYZ49103.1 P-type conjugative transfer protein TrbJ [Propylenella binzhouense]
MKTKKTHALRAALVAGVTFALPFASTMTSAPPAHAITVFDPSNYAQNVIQAARALQQINNQITSLQNEAQMILNQARNLASLPYSSLQQLQQSVQRTQQLLGQAQRIAYDVQNIEEQFRQNYGRGGFGSATDQQLVEGARERWRTSVAGFEDALKTQATVVGNLDTARAQLSALVSASQGATGALQATQAGNQLVALQTQQLTDLTALVAAQGRSQALEQARQAASQEQAREQLRRFLAPGAGYQPTAVQMFHGN